MQLRILCVFSNVGFLEINTIGSVIVVKVWEPMDLNSISQIKSVDVFLQGFHFDIFKICIAYSALFE